MDRLGLLKFLCGFNITISSILAAVIAFMFSARNALRGSGLSALESFYRKIILALIIIFSVSVVSLLYFSINFFTNIQDLEFCNADCVFIILVLAILPAVAVLWICVYFRHS